LNKFVLISLGLAAISGVGVLSSNIFSIGLQPFQVFNSFSDFDNSVCTCAGDDGQFTMENCEGFDGSPYSDPNMLCVSETAIQEYGDRAPLSIQGCGVDFWKNNLSISGLATIESGNTIWPSGYQPEYYFNDMFHTTISQPQNVLVGNEEKESEDRKNKDGDDVSSPNDVISGESENELGDDDKNNSKDKEDGIGKAEEKDEKEKLRNEKQEKGPTLLEALEANGGEMNGLLRNSVAALLNAAHSEINYPYSVSQVITMTQVALINQDWQKTSDLFEESNEKAEKPPLCLG